MRNRMLVQFVSVVGLLTVCSYLATAQTTHHSTGAATSDESSEVDAEVRQFFTEYFESVEQHELRRFLAFFIEGEGLTIFEDQEVYDWDGFVAYAEGFFEYVAEITLKMEKCDVDVLTPSIAVATGAFRGTGKAASGEPFVIHNAYTFVLLKIGDRWRIKHVHESSL